MGSSCCKGSDDSFWDEGKTPVAITPLTRALNKLALDLYSKITKITENYEDPNKINIVFSPFSIALALAMAETGSSGKTRSEIHRLIGCGKTPECGQLYGALQDEILKIQKTDGELRIVNAFFHDVRVNVKEAYVKKVKEWFKTEVNQVTFGEDEDWGFAVKAEQLINRWVSDKTAGKIEPLYRRCELKWDAALVLVNAIYLKMDWKNCFELENTKEKIFYRFGGKEEQKVQFMCRLSNGIYYNVRKTLRVVELPYKGDAMCMYIVLPRRRDGIKDLETKLNVDRLISLFKSTRSRRVNLQIPRFSMCHVLKHLQRMFSKMGFQTFNGLKQMTDDSVEISDGIHWAYIEVDEKGMKEPVDDTVQEEGQSEPALSADICNFIADHPFMFFIVHKPTWSIVFMGRVTSVNNDDLYVRRLF